MALSRLINTKISLAQSMPYLYLCLSQLMVATNVIGTKVIANQMSPWLAVWARYVIATLFVFGWYLLQGNIQKAHFKVKPHQWRSMIVLALCAGALFNLSLLKGLQYASASMAGIIISLLPAAIALTSVVVFKERLSNLQKWGIALALMGLILINSQSSSSQTSTIASQWLGLAFLLLSLVPETIYYVLSKFYKNTQPMLVYSGYLNLINVIALTPILLIEGQLSGIHINLSCIKVLLITGIASAYFYIFWAQGIKSISASKAVIFTALSPLITVCFAALLLGEQVRGLQIVGMTFVIGSIVLSSKK